ncbi:WAT1-related protein At3g28050-like [Rosa rugosa]|uniref:WAT1-related protein At3g28050-like n=1 Tax=Rosa rugosa TaxID=74645 RepID=UPI002B40B689|nr:WAT1-related protein At3g28050-like [Rosa rugosa]
METYLPFAGMVMVECLDVGMTTLSKAAMSRGMSHFVFVVYSNALATLILLPSSFIIHRNKRPPLTFSILCKFFLLSLAGITIMQNCVFTGVNYSSPTLASAMSNLVPAFTFFLAVIFRMEKLDLRNSMSQIKIMGTLVSISGALIVTLYKGAPLLGTPVQSIPDSSPSNTSSSTSMNNWIIGGLFLATASSCLAIWNTAQAAILKGYPSEMTIVSFYSLFGTIQCTILSLFVERNPSAWTLRPDIELASIFYSAICGGVVTFSVQTWCIKKKGPVFVAMFKPLGIAIAALLSAIFLGEELHVGSLIGAVVIVVGFYGVIWAQSKEEKGLDIKTKEDSESQEDDEIDRLQSSSQKKPLLESEVHV